MFFPLSIQTGKRLLSDHPGKTSQTDLRIQTRGSLISPVCGISESCSASAPPSGRGRSSAADFEIRQSGGRVREFELVAHGDRCSTKKDVRVGDRRFSLDESVFRRAASGVRRRPGMT
jgi:hypothetical protein